MSSELSSYQRNRLITNVRQSLTPSKDLIIKWIKYILPDFHFKEKIEELGNGVIYCKIFNYYFG
jgi:hypothetical protein